MKKVKLIRGLLKEVSSQRTQYKPYNYTLGFEGGFTREGYEVPPVLVELEISSDMVVEEKDNVIVVNLDGLKAILKVTADAIDELDEEHKRSLQ